MIAKVSLLDYTGKGRDDEVWHAAHLLVFTKNTRLEMSPTGFSDVQNKPSLDILDELEYMAGTIPSSWEFVDVTFVISDVTRACAQQITRTRTASYAMQSQRVTDVSSAAVTCTVDPQHQSRFRAMSDQAMRNYADLINDGVPAQDARGLLPMNVQCNLVAKYNLRALVELVAARKSLRAQGEYADIVLQMETLVLEAWPWAIPFFKPKHDRAIEMLEAVVRDVGLDVGSGAGWQVAKAIDLIRKG